MPTNLHIDDALLARVMELGRFKTKREAVEDALRSKIELLNRQELLSAIGTVDLGPAYDRKADAGRHAEKMVRLGVWTKDALLPAPARKPTKRSSRR